MAEPHRYTEMGGKCQCGLDRWHEAHFNGDRVAAGAAFEQHRMRHDREVAWQRSLAPGDPVMISENHPKPELAGAIGKITNVSKSTDGMCTVGVKLSGTEINVRLQWVQEVPLPAAPPKFSSPEEADRWLEDTAREMGLKTGPDVPQFATQEEADEWLEAQQRLKSRDPYVPPSWRWDQQPASGAEWTLSNGQVARQSGAYVRQQMSKVRKNESGGGIRGVAPSQIIIDEVAKFVEDEMIIDPYADDK